MNKKLWLLLTAFVLALALVACGGGGEKPTEPADEPAPAEETPTEEAMAEEAPTEEAMAEEASTEETMTEETMIEYPEIEPVRIALVIPSTSTDVSWSQCIFDSLIDIQEHYGKDVVEVAFTENMWNVTDASVAIRDYADSGYNLIIAHGAQYGTSLFEIAPDYPETSFAWGTTTNWGEAEGVENVFAYEPRAEEGGYVTGVIAAKLTESGVIGLVGPIDAGDAKLHTDGVVAGVTDTDPDVRLNVSFTGSFGDTALAAEAANTHIADGADILTGSSQQVVGAISVANDAGVSWIGIHADQTPLAPEIVKAMVIYDWVPALLDMITANQAGEYGGRVLQLTLANGGQRIIYSDDLPEDVVEAAQAAEAGIIDGSITIEAPPRN